MLTLQDNIGNESGTNEEVDAADLPQLPTRAELQEAQVLAEYVVGSDAPVEVRAKAMERALKVGVRELRKMLAALLL